MHESPVGYSFEPNLGLSQKTGAKFAQLFDDMIRLENDLEIQRKYKISQVNIRQLYMHIDRDMKGFCTLK